MNCADLEANLTEFLEGALDSDTEAVALEHLATCPRCEMVLRETRSVIDLAQRHGTEPLAARRRDELLASLLTVLRGQSH